MKKAAIVFCGFARSYKKTYKNFYNRFINCNSDWEIDVYFNFQPFICGKNSTKKQELNLNDLKSFYKNSLINIYQIDENEIEKKYLEIKGAINLPKSHNKPSFIKGSILSQFYGWAVSMASINADDYDLIIKNRSDILPKKEIELNSINPSVLTSFKRSDMASFGIDDFVFCSSQTNMKQIMNIFTNFLLKENLKNLPMAFPEWILDEYCKAINIDVVKGPQLTTIYR